jgi:hypothetical protein
MCQNASKAKKRRSKVRIFLFRVNWIWLSHNYSTFGLFPPAAQDRKFKSFFLGERQELDGMRRIADSFELAAW